MAVAVRSGPDLQVRKYVDLSSAMGMAAEDQEVLVGIVIHNTHHFFTRCPGLPAGSIV